MKRRPFRIVAICLLLVLVIGCLIYAQGTTPNSGYYYATGSYEEKQTPYLFLDPETQTFRIAMGTYSSYAETGSYEIHGRTLTATSHNTVYTFYVTTHNTMILTDNGDHSALQPPKYAVFNYDNVLR